MDVSPVLLGGRQLPILIVLVGEPGAEDTGHCNLRAACFFPSEGTPTLCSLKAALSAVTDVPAAPSACAPCVLLHL